MNKASGSEFYIFKNPNENVRSVLQLKREVLFYKKIWVSFQPSERKYISR